MPTVIAVTGPAHSGTSLVAGVLHTMGVWMADELPVPAPGSYVQWEDKAFSLLATGAALRRHPIDQLRLRKWFMAREHSARQMAKAYDVAGWGVKSPSLALHRYQFEDVAAAHGHVVQWITCGRSPDAIRAARRAWLERWAKSSSLSVGLAVKLEEDLDRRIRDALPIRGAVHIDFDTWRDDPDGLALHLCDSLNLNPSRAAAGAAAITPRRQ